MKTAVFSTKPYDREFLSEANGTLGHELVFFEPRLTAQTVRLVHGFPAVCAFVNDQLDAEVLDSLAGGNLLMFVQRRGMPKLGSITHDCIHSNRTALSNHHAGTNFYRAQIHKIGLGAIGH